MTITPSLFEALLKCPTKCWLRANSETPTGNSYAEWVQSQNESFRATQTERLLAGAPPSESVQSPSPENLKTSKWRLAVDTVARARTPGQLADGTSALPNAAVGTDSTPSQESQGRGWNASLPVILESHLHAVERVPSTGRGKAAQFIPIRFVFFNKLDNDDRQLLAFDAFVLSAVLGREIAVGKIIHGDDHATLKVKTSALAGKVRKRLEKITVLLSSAAPPDLVLNRHCAECEFQTRCRQMAAEKDDLSLLGGMKTDERKEYRSKGIFTVTQLSYTFRPRRRPK